MQRLYNLEKRVLYTEFGISCGKQGEANDSGFPFKKRPAE